MHLFERNADTERIKFLDNRLHARNALLREILKFHVQGEVRRIAEIAQNVNVLALPHRRNLDTRNNFEPDFLGRFFGELVTVEIVVVRD